MSGVVLTTISPSSPNSSRRTPWVEGCCGPIEIVICVSSGRSTISNCGGMFTAVLIGLFVAQTLVCVLGSLSHWERVGVRVCRRHAARPLLTPPKGRGINYSIPNCTVRTLAKENPFVAHDLASRRAKECDVDQDDRQRLRRTNRKSRARASSPSARCYSRSGRVYRPLPISHSYEVVDG